LLVFVAFAWATGLLAATVSALAGLLLGGAASLGGFQMAGAALPAMAALGLMMGQLKDGPPPLVEGTKPPALSQGEESPVELIAVLSGKAGAVSADRHVTFVDWRAKGAVDEFARTRDAMLKDLAGAKIPEGVLEDFGARPIGSYRRINAVTLRVDPARAEDFTALLKAAGHQVFPSERRRIVPPVEVKPEQMDPAVRAPVTMDEVITITKADKVQEIARERWGPPEGWGFWGRLLSRILGAVPPQPPVAVNDSGRALSHKLVKDVPMVNLTDGPDVDDIGHGTWVTSMVLNYARWARKVTHYKAFVDGSASTDDVLKTLTASANDGNIVISNSWGSDDGDPKAPDSLLVAKLAEEGHVLVFAAGNAGPGANTIGSPAIVHYRDAKTGAARVISVAAAGRDKKTAFFSSRGPGSRKTKGDPDYPHDPHVSAIGANVEGAFPQELGPDRVDPAKGPVKAWNGTSMSTPEVAGAVALLCMLFGVTVKGDKLDAVVNAVMGTLEKTGQSRDAEGEGFLDIEAAYRALDKILTPVAPNRVVRWLLRSFGGSR
jgi:hypothetical protein